MRENSAACRQNLHMFERSYICLIEYSKSVEVNSFCFSSFIKFSFLGSSILKSGDNSEKEDSSRLGASDYIAIGEFFIL